MAPLKKEAKYARSEANRIAKGKVPICRGENTWQAKKKARKEAKRAAKTKEQPNAEAEVAAEIEEEDENPW